jgi:hypothetical protein
VANVHVSAEEVVVELTPFEKAESVHGDLRVPRGSIRAAAVVDDPVRSFTGHKVIGSRVPGVFAIGSFRDETGSVFAVVHHGTPRGVRIELDGATYDVVVIGCEDPEAIVSELGVSSSPS